MTDIQREWLRSLVVAFICAGIGGFITGSLLGAAAGFIGGWFVYVVLRANP